MSPADLKLWLGVPVIAVMLAMSMVSLATAENFARKSGDRASVDSVTLYLLAGLSMAVTIWFAIIFAGA